MWFCMPNERKSKKKLQSIIEAEADEDHDEDEVLCHMDLQMIILRKEHETHKILQPINRLQNDRHEV